MVKYSIRFVAHVPKEWERGVLGVGIRQSSASQSCGTEMPLYNSWPKVSEL